MIQQQRISYLYGFFFFSVQIDLSVGCTRSLHKTLITCGRAYALESRRSTIGVQLKEQAMPTNSY